ncbi:MAG TPA: hypothetical protein VHN59_12340 [Chitinophagaceae bacterium]|nr:hypothetical protein [Chitinophagaceae bacterium]
MKSAAGCREELAEGEVSDPAFDGVDDDSSSAAGLIRKILRRFAVLKIN